MLEIYNLFNKKSTMFLLLLYVMSQNLCKILYLETILSKVCHQTYTNEGGNKYVNLEHFVVNTRF